MNESLPRASVVKLASNALPPKTRLAPGLADLLHDSADHLIRSLASQAAAVAEKEVNGEQEDEEARKGTGKAVKGKGTGTSKGKGKGKAKANGANAATTKKKAGKRKSATVEHTHVATALEDLGAEHLQDSVDEAVDAVNTKSQKKAKRRKKLTAEEQAVFAGTSQVQSSLMVCPDLLEYVRKEVERDASLAKNMRKAASTTWRAMMSCLSCRPWLLPSHLGRGRSS